MANRRPAHGLTRLLGLLAASLMLQGCIAQWQAEGTKAKADFEHFRGQEQQRDNYQTCVNQGAMPGTPENLACQLDLARKEQQPAKPQNASGDKPSP